MTADLFAAPPAPACPECANPDACVYRFDCDACQERLNYSNSNARKAASAAIAKIPLPLSRYIAEIFHPLRTAA